MKLLGCYIENFGGLSAREIRFDEGITSLCEENGTGKTTLACFIKAMFYGMESYRSNAKEFGDRQHFYPFAGGNFGGNLTFEWEGHVYKIERFFGEKSDTADTLTVYCDGVPTEALGEEIGKCVFGMDKESFERTLFVTSNEMECAATTDIGVSLNRFLVGGDDVDYDKACALVERAASALKKSRGAGAIAKERAALGELVERMKNAETVQAELFRKYESYDALCAEIDALEARVTRAQTENALLAEWAQYEYMCAKAEEAKCAGESIVVRYPAGLPQEQEVSEVALALEQKKENALLIAAQAEGTKEAQMLEELSGRFGEEAPSEERIVENEQISHRLTALGEQIAALENVTYGEREKDVIARFEKVAPSEQTVGEITCRLEAYRAAMAAYEAQPSTLTSKKERGTKGGVYLPVAIGAVGVLVVGVLLLFVNALLGGLFLAVGGVTLFADGFLYLNRKAEGASATVQNPEKARLLAEWQKEERELSLLLSGFGCTAEPSVEVAAYRLLDDLSVYGVLCRKEEDRRAKLASAKQEYLAFETALSTFLSRYGFTGKAYPFELSCLRAAALQYRALIERKALAAKEIAQLEAKNAVIDEKLLAFSQKYALSAIDAPAIAADVRAAKAYAEAFEKAKSEAKAYRTQKGLSQKPEGAPVDIEALSKRLHALRDEKSMKWREIEADESVADAVELYRNERDEAKERIAEMEERYRILSATLTMLKGAEKSLKEKYVKPVKDRFLHYAALIEEMIGERVTMGENFKITFERNGKERSEKHLSAGQRAIAALCFRLALVENMYGGEIPFLVMDDPFVAMDETHLARVRRVLSEIAENTQILYFCCHESRNMQ